MEKIIKIKRYVVQIAVIFFIFLCYQVINGTLDYYNYRQPPNIVLVRDDSRRDTMNNVICAREDKNAIYFKDMAYLSASVYNKGESETYNGWEFVEEVSTSKNWSFLFLSDSNDIMIRGLKYSIWKHPLKKIIVIVFRGTTGIIDFHSNLHWFFKFIDIAFDQYEQLPEVLEKIISSSKDKFGQEYEFFATGHSLGGGLAQHAVYQSKDIKKAFVFNSSPVTGWTDLSDDEQQNAVGSQIYRIHEHGEILELFRFIMKGGYIFDPRANEDPYIKEYQLNLRVGHLFAQHSIDTLAIELNKVSCMSKNKN